MKKPYTKSAKWNSARVDMIARRRILTAKRNVQIYKDMTEGYVPADWKRVAEKHHLSRQRLHMIKHQVQKMLDNNELDLSLFDY